MSWWFDLHSTCHALCYVWFRSQVEAANQCAKIMWLNVSGLAASLKGNKWTPNNKVQGPGFNICYSQNTTKIKLKGKTAPNLEKQVLIYLMFVVCNTSMTDAMCASLMICTCIKHFWKQFSRQKFQPLSECSWGLLGGGYRKLNWRAVSMERTPTHLWEHFTLCLLHQYRRWMMDDMVLPISFGEYAVLIPLWIKYCLWQFPFWMVSIGIRHTKGLTLSILYTSNNHQVDYVNDVTT